MTRPVHPLPKRFAVGRGWNWTLAWLGFVFLGAAPILRGAVFTPLLPLPVPAIRQSSAHFLGEQYDAAHLLDADLKTEYASNSRGTNTEVEFDFGAPVSIAAFRHIDRKDIATIAESKLTFLNADGSVITSLSVKHADRPGGETFLAFPAAITAQRVKWHVTKVGNPEFAAVGGLEISFFTAGKAEPWPARDVLETQVSPVLKNDGGAGVQNVEVVVHHWYSETSVVDLNLAGVASSRLTLQPGPNLVTLDLPRIEVDKTEKLTLQMDGKTVCQTQFVRHPVRPLTIYVLPHSHTDIGYTEIQTAVQTKQVNNLLAGIAAARRTANYPPGARFVWNVEVAWAADLYLQRLSEAQRQEFFEAVKKGWVGLNGMYLNELTSLCRPEELLRLFRFGAQLGEQSGVPVDAAMISDVPGFTWGTVTAMSQAGIKYLSAAPNYFDRIGDILLQNENKPFYWVSPSGRDQVLVWIPLKGYALSHTIGNLSAQFVNDYEADLDQEKYPYDIAYIRWAGHGDNSTPDPAICDFIKDWNGQYVWPKFVIATTHDAFDAFAQRYGERLPRLRGDLTPYWEDGAGSSAFETALNRANADRLTQAEALWTLLNPAAYPATNFNDAWRNVLLYSEHTWGANVSVSDPASKKTGEQWAIKRAYATDADQQSRALLAEAAQSTAAGKAVPASVDIYNTTSWPRAELVTLTHEQAAAGDRVTDEQGHPVPSQRLATGELVFRVEQIPPFASRRYQISAGEAYVSHQVAAHDNQLSNELLHIEVDPKTGGITELTAPGIAGNLVDTASGEQLNEYLFLPSNKLADLRSNDPAKITVKESGPLLASLLIESGAPGCNRLIREVRLGARSDFVEIIDTVDKQPAAIPTHPPDSDFAQHEGKESVNFAFPFQVPDGQLRLDVPFGVMRPELDQLPGSCKNWFPVNRWVDVANQDFGVSWVTLDAPLIEVGELSARMLGSQTDPKAWRQHVAPTQKFYSWVMNNHWSTNYRANQAGPVTFRYFIRPHKRTGFADISRFALGFSQPLLAEPAGKRALIFPRLNLSSPDVLVTVLKPSDDGRAWIVRLFEASGSAQTTHINWNSHQPKALFLSDTTERAGEKISDNLSFAGFELKTLRVEF